jgi:hypothetical protein
MPFNDPEAARAWRQKHKRKLRQRTRATPLHSRLGIRTVVHRQAILHDVVRTPMGRARLAWSRDPVTGVGPNNHLYRVSITLPAL